MCPCSVVLDLAFLPQARACKARQGMTACVMCRFYALVWGAILVCASLLPTFRHFREHPLHKVHLQHAANSITGAGKGHSMPTKVKIHIAGH